MELVFLLLTVIALIATVVFGFLQVVGPFIKGELKFSKRWPFVTNTEAKPTADTDTDVGIPKMKKERVTIDLHTPLENQKALKSIAVLPFADMSAQKDQEYFCDGVSEELINALTKVGDLRVVARTSAFAFKGKATDIREIGKKLNVRTVLEGSVRKAGNNLRITAQLVNVADGFHLWSERYDRQMEDVFTIQDEISRAIVDTLKIKLLSREKASLIRYHTKNLEAYNLYLKGRFYWNKRTGETLKRGIEYFEQAIKKDPGYALAHSGLADCFVLLPWYAVLPANEAYPKAKAAAIKALELDDTLAEAHTSLAYAMIFNDYDWSGAEKEFQRAFELEPTYATAHQWYAEYLSFLGRTDEAIAASKRALESDPLSLVISSVMGMAFYFAHQYDRAMEQFKKTLEMDPNFYVANLCIGQLYAQESMFEDAERAFQRTRTLSGGNTLAHALLGRAYGLAGKKKEAQEVLEQLMQLSAQRHIPAFNIAIVYAGLDERDLAFDWFEKAYEERDLWMFLLKVEPMFDNLRSDPRFQSLLHRMNFPET